MDFIIGTIEKQLNENEYYFQLEKIGIDNKFDYHDKEIIKILINKPMEIGTRVHLNIHYRDTYNRIICDVEFLN